MLPTQLAVLRCTCGTILAVGNTAIDRPTIEREQKTRICPTCALKAAFDEKLKALESRIARLRLPPPSSRDF